MQAGSNIWISKLIGNSYKQNGPDIDINEY